MSQTTKAKSRFLYRHKTQTFYEAELAYFNDSAMWLFNEETQETLTIINAYRQTQSPLIFMLFDFAVVNVDQGTDLA